MKKKLLTVLMAVTMMATLVTGCGKKEETEGDKVVESVEESKEESKADDAEESKEESKADDAEESKEESKAENAEESKEESKADDAEESKEESKADDAEESKAETDVVISSVDGDGKDWSVAYDDYFMREDIMSRNIKCIASTSAEGVTFDLTVAVANETMWMGYDFGTVSFNMYVLEGKVYACTAMEGEEVWTVAAVGSEDELSGLTDMADTSVIDTKNIKSSTYREAIEEDGIIYDVLDVEVDDGTTQCTAVYFVNRDSQKVEKCVVEQEGATVVCLLEEIESVELPKEALNATESTMEDVMTAMMTTIFAGASAGME